MINHVEVLVLVNDVIAETRYENFAWVKNIFGAAWRLCLIANGLLANFEVKQRTIKKLFYLKS